MPEVERTAERNREDPMKSFMKVRGRPDNTQADGQSDEYAFGICFEVVSCKRHFGPTVDETISKIGP